MKKDFNQSSYIAQVRRLRRLAEVALTRFPLRIKSVSFIHHGENATFKIVAADNKKFLLRIHRGDYHTQPGIEEELRWLARLSQHLLVPKPVKSKRGRWVESVSNEDFPQGRHCCLFEWLDGRLIKKSITLSHMFKLGRLLAQIQAVQPSSGVRHRRYWNAEGLVGKSPKFGPLQKIPGIPHKTQKLITKGNALVFKKLKNFEKRFPQKLGMIHADLHFGNVVMHDKQFAAIDFDDCGFGFYAYDLAIPLVSVEYFLGYKNVPKYRAALVQGYSDIASWDENDEDILDDLICARRLAMLGWFNSRRENPRLRKHIPWAVQKTKECLRKTYRL